LRGLSPYLSMVIRTVVRLARREESNLTWYSYITSGSQLSLASVSLFIQELQRYRGS